tara:strand:+ start:856 stop:2157 length:1302 start_codon:yes stop_codon:yes gene_type:complete
MDLGISNFFENKEIKRKIGDFQDLDHIDGVSVSSISCGLYEKKRDDLVLFYFRDKAHHASVFTQSNVISENIKWNKKITSKTVSALVINTRNANALTGFQGFESIKKISLKISDLLSKNQSSDDNLSKKINPKEILFASTGTIGEKFPLEKILNNIPNLIDKIKYVQNKYIWLKAALAIMTTDTKPKMCMSECKIGSTPIKVYGIAKGSGMIFPNMATTLGFVFTDADLNSDILKKILSRNIDSTFNAISCDGETSTNDMVSIFATAKKKHPKIINHNDNKLKSFENSLKEVLLNLSKSVVLDGEGASKFITIKSKNCKTETDAKTISFSVANSPLVKTAIFGEDPNWGRIVMAIGKCNAKINIKKLSIKIGNNSVFLNGEVDKNYNEDNVKNYMKNNALEIIINIGTGTKSFTAYTMDLTQNYIKINSDYRS